MRTRRQVRGRGPRPPRKGQPGSRRPQARRKRPQRARLHRRGQDGLVQQLLPRRRLSLLHMPLHWPAGLQARRRGSHLERRGAAVRRVRGKCMGRRLRCCQYIYQSGALTGHGMRRPGLLDGRIFCRPLKMVWCWRRLWEHHVHLRIVTRVKTGATEQIPYRRAESSAT